MEFETFQNRTIFFVSFFGQWVELEPSTTKKEKDGRIRANYFVAIVYGHSILP